MSTIQDTFSTQGKKRVFQKKNLVPYSLIHSSFEEGWEKSLLFFCKLKKIYKNPVFYNYSLRKLSKLTGYSTYCISHHVNKLIQLELATIRDGNLCLSGINKLRNLCKKRKFLVPIEYHSCDKDHMTALMFTLIKRKLICQSSEVQKLLEIIKFQEDILNESSKVKRIIKREQKFRDKYKNIPIEKVIQNGTTLSNKAIGELLNRNQQTGLKIQKELNRLGYIKSFRRIRLTEERLSKKSFELAKYYGSLDEQVIRGKNGVLFYQDSNLIILPEETNDYLNYINELYLGNDFTELLTIKEQSDLIIEKPRDSKEFNPTNSRLRQYLKNKHYSNSIKNKIKPLQSKENSTELKHTSNFSEKTLSKKNLTNNLKISDFNINDALDKTIKRIEIVFNKHDKGLKLTKSEKQLFTISNKYDGLDLIYALMGREYAIHDWKSNYVENRMNKIKKSLEKEMKKRGIEVGEG